MILRIKSKLHNLPYKTSYNLHPVYISALLSLLFIHAKILILSPTLIMMFPIYECSLCLGCPQPSPCKPNSYLSFKDSSQVAPPPKFSLKGDMASKTQRETSKSLSETSETSKTQNSSKVLQDYISIFYCGMNT